MDFTKYFRRRNFLPVILSMAISQKKVMIDFNRMKITAIILAALVAVPVSQAFAGTVTFEFSTSSEKQVSNSNPSERQVEDSVTAGYGSSNNRLVAGYMSRHDGIFYQCYVTSSLDTGSTWPGTTIFNHPTGTRSTNDPWTTTNSANTHYITCLSFDDTDDDPYVIWRSSSTDAVTWSTPTNVITYNNPNLLDPNKTPDQPAIASSSGTTNVHACWTQIDDTVTPHRISIMYQRISPNSSSSREELGFVDSYTENSLVQNCNIAVGTSGQIYVTWVKYTSSTSGRLQIARSYDSGTTWTAAIDIPNTTFTRISPCSASPLGCLSGTSGTMFRANHKPDIAVDLQNDIHIAWPVKSGTTTDIKYTQSVNCDTSGGSCTFLSSPPTINSVTTGDQWQPAIFVAPQTETGNNRGILHVTALDRRDDTNNVNWRTYDYHCHLTDAGGCSSAGSWTNTQVTGQSSNNLGADFIGDYRSMVGTSSRQAIVLWPDSRNGDTSNKNFDIYMDRSTS